MKSLYITKDNAGQTLFRYAGKVLKRAPDSFLYKNLRKKNIDINKKKCTGKEILREGDEVHFWLSDETFARFSEEAPAVQRIFLDRSLEPAILYEDDDVILVNKPAGLLTQRDHTGTVSLNDWLLGHVPAGPGVSPSVCNRLDRNTSGIVACGKTVRGLQALSACFRDRTVHKYYTAIVWGRPAKEGTIRGFLQKDRAGNETCVAEGVSGEARAAETRYRRLRSWQAGDVLLSGLEVFLVIGRSHQIRIHMAHIGCPLLGDRKYGTRESLAGAEMFGVRRQLLHAGRLEFPVMEGPLAALSGTSWEAPLPDDFRRIWQAGEGRL